MCRNPVGMAQLLGGWSVQSWDELSRQRKREHDTCEQWKAGVYGRKDSSTVGSHRRWGWRSGQGPGWERLWGSVRGLVLLPEADTEGFKGLWQGGGECRIKYAFYLSCLFNFGFCFCFYIPNILLCSDRYQSFLCSLSSLPNLERLSLLQHYRSARVFSSRTCLYFWFPYFNLNSIVRCLNIACFFSW